MIENRHLARGAAYKRCTFAHNDGAVVRSLGGEHCLASIDKGLER